jgi:hypothetical protein
MMYEDLEGKMKEKLLEGLIEHMHGKMGEHMMGRMPKKEMEVSVAAPDKEHLKEGINKAKAFVEKSPMDMHEMDKEDGMSPAMMHGEPDGDEGSDEDRLMELLGDNDDDDEDDGKDLAMKKGY